MDKAKLKRKIDKLIENKGDTAVAQLDVALELSDKLDVLGDQLGKQLTPEGVEVALEVDSKDLNTVLNEVFENKDNRVVELLTEIRDKDEEEETELLRQIARNTEKEDVVIPAPVVSVSPTPVEIDLNAVTVSVTDLHQTAKEIKDILSIKEEFEPSQIFDKDGNPLDWNEIVELLKEIRDKESSTRGGGYASNLGIVANTQGVAPLSGSTANGARELTVANTWYAVPSTVPTQPYHLVVTQEIALGTIRWGFDNTGTPSATNGNQAPSQLTVRLSPGQVIYYASSTAGDDVNWTTKVI